MKRWHQDYTKSFKEWKKHCKDHVEFNYPCNDQVGRFRKRKALDCGNPQCYICHSDKYPKRNLTRQELISKLKHHKLETQTS